MCNLKLNVNFGRVMIKHSKAVDAICFETSYTLTAYVNDCSAY